MGLGRGLTLSSRAGPTSLSCRVPSATSSGPTSSTALTGATVLRGKLDRNSK